MVCLPFYFPAHTASCCLSCIFPRRVSAAGANYINSLQQLPLHKCKTISFFLKLTGESCQLTHQSLATTRLGTESLYTG